MTSHRHEGFSMLPETLTGRWPVGLTAHVDAGLIGQLVSAPYDSGTACGDTGLDKLATDPPTTVGLIEWACRALRFQLDDLRTRSRATVSVPAMPELCCIAIAFRSNWCGLYNVVVHMDEGARRSTAVTALEIIVNDLMSGGALDGAWRPTSALPLVIPAGANRPGRVGHERAGQRGPRGVWSDLCPLMSAPAETVRASGSTGAALAGPHKVEIDPWRHRRGPSARIVRQPVRAVPASHNARRSRAVRAHWAIRP